MKDGDEILVRDSIRLLESWGLKVICAPNLFEQEELFEGSGSYVPGSINRRIESLLQLWSNPQIDGLLALRGGYGCIQLLEELDYKWIKSNPKPVFGYSDLTALFCAIHSQSYKDLNLELFHTPMLCDLPRIDQESINSFINLLQKIDIDSYRKGQFRINNKEKICGGNLSLITSLIGTKYLPSFQNNILFLEDCKEPGYKTQKMLHQMRLAKLFEGIKELWIGTALETIYDHNLLKQITQESSCKLVLNKPIGHGETNHSIALY